MRIGFSITLSNKYKVLDRDLIRISFRVGFSNSISIMRRTVMSSVESLIVLGRF